MYLCYLDESGTPDLPGNTSHYILAGVSIPIWQWRTCDFDIARIKRKFALSGELHTAWLLRKYLEQSKIPEFNTLTYFERGQAVEQWRRAELLRLQRDGNSKRHKETKKVFRHTAAYVHLTLDERRQLVREIATCVGGWGFARLFAECINKIHFTPTHVARTPDEEALEQVVSRFEHYLRAISDPAAPRIHGLLIHDNNETVAKKHTGLMLKFHESGTLWTDVVHIMETPLFVNSELTGMVQVADLCSYSLRRYCENGESELFDLIYPRADHKPNGKVVGVRHFSPPGCQCKICQSRDRISN
jgi:hypothetical protein